MYRVLLVDDEPLILSGIKFMIDWEQHDCRITAAVSNGQKALEIIRAEHTDIVVCDISMPALSGIELLEKANTESPETVFIMLTNHPDFEFAKHSLQNRAVDYLLKSQLDSGILADSLEKAIAERNKREQLASMVFMDKARKNREQELIQSTLSSLIQAAPGAKLDKTVRLLDERHLLESYAVLYLPADFSGEYQPENDEDSQSTAELFLWHRDIVERTAGNSFPDHFIFTSEREGNSLFIFCRNADASKWESRLNIFTEKLRAASSNITQLTVNVLATPIYKGKDQAVNCRSRVIDLCNTYYLSNGAMDCPLIRQSDLKPPGPAGLGERLAAELQARHASGCAAVIDRAINQISSVPHEKSRALWLYGELSEAVDHAFGSERAVYTPSIPDIVRRDQLIRLLTHLKEDVLAMLAPSVNSKTEFLEKARQYVRDHVSDRIILQDAADYANVSPGYLSSLHNKIYNQKFVDYINQVKMESARKMISDGKYRISEIAYMLSFENAYYFTRVFKKHMGMTPSEYQKMYWRKRG